MHQVDPVRHLHQPPRVHQVRCQTPEPAAALTSVRKILISALLPQPPAITVLNQTQHLAISPLVLAAPFRARLPCAALQGC